MAIINIQDTVLRAVCGANAGYLAPVTGIKFPDGSTQIIAAGASQWIVSGANIYNANTGKVGINTILPTAWLEVDGTGNVILIAGGGTSNLQYRATNTGGDIVMGIEGLAGNGLFTGSSPYGAAFGTENATDLFLGTNGVARLKIGSAGGLTLLSLGAFVAGDKYLVINASGVVHTSAVGPAS